MITKKQAKETFGEVVTVTHELRRDAFADPANWWHKVFKPEPINPTKGLIIGKRTVFLERWIDGGYDEPMHVSRRQNKRDVYLVVFSPHSIPIRALPEHIQRMPNNEK